MSDRVVQIEKINYSTKDRRLLFRNFYAEFYKNKINVITGKNGSGKSTLLKLISGILIPESGSIHKNHKKLFFLKQSFNNKFHINLTLNDIVGFSGVSSAEIHSFATKYAILSKSQLETGWNEASGGEKQKALILRMFFSNADLLLIDEPFNHLDAASQEVISEFFLKIAQSGEKTLILVSHILSSSLLGSSELHTICLDNHIKD